MFSELVDVLRCPRPHEESWLVLAAHRLNGRDIMAGVLGCPVCHAEYPIADGVARFVNAPDASSAGASNEDEALRLVALLDLTGARGYAVVLGDLTNHAVRMRELTDVQLLLVNPPTDLATGSGLSGLTIGRAWTALPLAGASARAIAFDDRTTPAQLASGIEVVAPGGRILAPVALSLPDGLTELVRDDRQWLAERQQAPRSSGIISLQRRK
ncbi:MAG TPA: hypothetical protein VGJ18_22375 [Gemmatimonadaceae bacterium]|jgi:uncharacterized protein YbaR (Trm112 family)